MNEKATLLIVDNDSSCLESMQIILGNSEYHLLFATSGREAIKCLTLHSVDVILLDVMMPDLDGFDTCRLIKNNQATCNIPIILITALSERKYLIKGLDSGADDFLSKPLMGAELKARIRSMLRIKKQFDDLKNIRVFKKEFIEKLINDLRSPLEVISAYAGILRSQSSPSASTSIEIGEKIEIQCKKFEDYFATYKESQGFSTELEAAEKAGSQ